MYLDELRLHFASWPVLRPLKWSVNWVARLPVWVQVTPVETLDDAAFRPLGAGERAAITPYVVLCR
jgi:hypothetical protein